MPFEIRSSPDNGKKPSQREFPEGVIYPFRGDAYLSRQREGELRISLLRSMEAINPHTLRVTLRNGRHETVSGGSTYFITFTEGDVSSSVIYKERENQK
jgi:hypothetical protein